MKKELARVLFNLAWVRREICLYRPNLREAARRITAALAVLEPLAESESLPAARSEGLAQALNEGNGTYRP